VKAQGERGRARGFREKRLQRLAHVTVEQSAKRRQEPIVYSHPEPVMNEVEPFAVCLQHTTPHQLLDRFRRPRAA
jgi:hypothetical protein